MQIWEDFLRNLETELGHETVKKWLRSLKVDRFDARNLYLLSNDAFQISWFEEHIRLRFEKYIRTLKLKPILVHIDQLKKNNSPKKTKPIKKILPSPFTIRFETIDSYCRLENFIVNKQNELAFKVASKLSFEPESAFNPVYLYGPDGVGKTHLLMAIAQSYKEQGLSTLYTRGETFTDHLIAAIRAGEMNTFRNIYRHTDVLLIDDVDKFSKKGATQEEFFHTFNTLHLAGKQIILTAKVQPNTLSEIESRLISRFEWGITLPLYPLNEEEKRQLLTAKMAYLKFPLPKRIIDFLLDTFSRNTKILCHAFDALILRLHHHHKQGVPSGDGLTTPLVQRILSDLIQDEQKETLNPQKIVQKIAEHYGISIDDILGSAQTRSCTFPRQIAMYLCRSQLNLPFTKIGEFFHRDHSTVMTSVNQIKKNIDQNDPETNNVLSRMKML